MAFRSKEANTGAILILSMTLGAVGLRAAELKYQVRHDHLWKSGTGTLTFTEKGINFQERGEEKDEPHHGFWPYEDVQELHLAPAKVVIRTYEDRKWRLGADRRIELTIEGEQTFAGAYDLLKNRLDQRFVGAFADEPPIVLWEAPVKLKRLISGSQGVLQVGRERVVYRTTAKGESRTWRYKDIENISSSGPFDLTITTYEKSGRDYGDLRAFNFQLKRPLDPDRYNQLWRRLNRTKSVDLITSTQKEEQNQ